MFSIDKLMESSTIQNLWRKHQKKRKRKWIKFLRKTIKQIGRPVGDFDSKRLQYLKMLNDNKIKQPKQQTLEYYGINKDGDKYVLFT